MRLKFVVVLLIIAAINSVAAWSWLGNLAFEDHFNGTELNRSNWFVENTCKDFGSDRFQCYRPENVKVENGKLIITAKQLDEPIEGRNCTSGRIRQINNEFKYGAYVVRAKFPRGDHLHPAAWLLKKQFGDDGKECRYEEIDIVETRGQLDEIRNIGMAAYWGRTGEIIESHSEKITMSFSVDGDFHEYAVVWLPSGIEWFVDNVKYLEYSMETFINRKNIWPTCLTEDETTESRIAFSDETHFILNLAVGGNYFKNFKPMDPTTWKESTTMEVDWVKIYEYQPQN